MLDVVRLSKINTFWSKFCQYYFIIASNLQSLYFAVRGLRQFVKLEANNTILGRLEKLNYCNFQPLTSSTSPTVGCAKPPKLAPSWDMSSGLTDWQVSGSHMRPKYGTVCTAHCTLHTRYFTLDTEYYKLHTSNLILPAAHYTLYMSHHKLHATHCTLHIVHYKLHTTYCTLHTTIGTLLYSHCKLLTAHWTLNITYYILHTEHSIFHTAHRT